MQQSHASDDAPQNNPPPADALQDHLPQADALQGASLSAEALPIEGRLAGIDFGTVRIGLALSDPSQNWVTPLATYTRRGERQDIQYFLQLVRQEQLVGWVIGLPIHCSGDESQKSAEARRFAAWLSQQTRLPVALFDERFTTAEARQLLNQTQLSPQKKRQRLDGLAAHLILTHFLGARSRSSSGNAGLDDTVERLG